MSAEENKISVKEEIDGIIARMKQAVPNYRDREAQKTMHALVAQTFWNARKNETEPTPHVAVIEAPTGTGKSHGYLIPAIVVGRRLKKKVVVSSATIKLQEQLCQSDLPLIASCMDGELKYVLVKGRTRYVCPRKLEKESSLSGQMGLLDDTATNDSMRERDRKVITLQKDFDSGRWNGERDSAPVDDAMWADISTDRHGCLGRNCSHIKACPFFKARENYKLADVLVVNHDLMLSDLALGGGKVLPDPSECLYCIDEGHHLPKKTLQAFSSQHSLNSSIRTAERLMTALDHSIPESEHEETISASAEDLAEALNDLSRMLAGLESLSKPDMQLRFPFGQLPEALQEVGHNIHLASDTCSKALSGFLDEIQALIDDGTIAASNAERVVSDAGAFLGRIESIRDTWALMLTNPPDKAPPISKWINTVGGGSDFDYIISASPVSAAAKLKFEFWDKVHSAIVASATLRALGDFKLFCNRSGLTIDPSISFCRALPSPFNYEIQGKIVLPKMKTTPKNAEAHTIEVSEIIPKLFLNGGGQGMLCLFTSRKQMREVAESLPQHLREMVLMQGDVPMSDLITEHRSRVDAGKNSVLFGLDGLAEGLDLPGKYNMRVVIVKLPFAVPTDPIDAAVAEWLDSLGRSHFAEVAVPQAGVKLSQGVGRLIRTEDDYGDVYVLDSRLGSTNYGKQMLNGLPPFPVVIGAVVA